MNATFQEVAAAQYPGCYYGGVKTFRAPLMLFLVSVAALAQVFSVTSIPDPTGAFPKSRLYKVLIRNTGSRPIELAAVQMPGGYVGSGTFFNCTIEQWIPVRRQWITVRGTEEYPKSAVQQVQIAPGQEREVCRELLPPPPGRLPSAFGQPGTCMRFRLNRDWKPRSVFWFSASFLVGGDSPQKRCP